MDSQRLELEDSHASDRLRDIYTSLKDRLAQAQYGASLTPELREKVDTSPDGDWLLLEVMNLLYRDPQSRFELPKILRAPVQQFILFYYDHLEPYFVSFNGINSSGKRITLRKWKFELVNDYLYPFLLRLTESAEVYPSREDPLKALLQRLEAGLLRKEQAKLVGVVLESVTAEIRSIIRHTSPSEFLRLDDEGREVFVERIRSVGERGGRIITDFLCNERFRSERLELLLLRYLDEETVNIDVARGVEEATKLWMENGRHQELP